MTRLYNATQYLSPQLCSTNKQSDRIKNLTPAEVGGRSLQEDLTRRIGSLPPELYNTILNYTFTAQQAIHNIDETFLPPSRLDVNRAARDFFTASFYGGPDIFRATDSFIYRKWLSSLGPEHQRLVSKVHYDPPLWSGREETYTDEVYRSVAFASLLGFRCQISEYCPQIDLEALHVKVKFADEDAGRWTNDPEAMKRVEASS